MRPPSPARPPPASRGPLIAILLAVVAAVGVAVAAFVLTRSTSNTTSSGTAGSSTAGSSAGAPAVASTVVASASTVVASTPAATRPRGSTAFGVLDNTDAVQTPDQFWGDYAALHMRAYRADALWNVIAPTQPANALDPNDPAYQWGYLDTIVRAAGAHGAMRNMIITVWRTPQWATQYGGKYTSVEALRIKSMPKPALYAEFAHAIATRYSGSFVPAGSTEPLPAVHKWQVWNEPNTYLVPWKVDGVSVVARNYASLLNAGYASFKAVSPRNVVSNGGFGPSGQHQPELAPFTFVRALAKLGPRLDALSVHAYGANPGLGLRDGAGEGTQAPDLAPGNLKAWIAVADRAFGRKYRLWVTEFGWQTAPEDPQIGVSHADQAADMKGMFDLLRSTKRVDIGIWFLMRDEPDVGAGWQSGVRTAPGEEKPSYAVWSANG